MIRMKRLINICLASLVFLTLMSCTGGEQPSSASGTAFKLGDRELRYEGETKGGVIHGTGTLYLGSEKVYEGNFAEGRIEGQGRLYADGQVKYEGRFQNNQALGDGILYSKTGGKMFEGTITANDGETYQGTGTVFNGNEEPAYRGEITVKDNRVEFADRGQILYPTGEVFYDGELKDGMPSGEGFYYDPEGNVLMD